MMVTCWHTDRPYPEDSCAVAASQHPDYSPVLPGLSYAESEVSHTLLVRALSAYWPCLCQTLPSRCPEPM